jgi:MscS family membrane protein
MLQQTFLGNTLENYLWFAGIIIVGIVFKRLLSRIISYILFRFFRRKSYEVGVESFIHLLSAPFQFLIMVVLLYFACDRLSFPKEWHMASDQVFGVRFVLDHCYRGLMVGGITWMILRLVDFSALVFMARARRSASRTDDQLIPFLKEGIKVILAGVGLLILLATAFELDIVSLVTGLGIGGLAIALAAKETLENLLGSFTIFLDKPFVVGDQVKVGSIEGHVESIGFRSTRLRALDKMLVTVPNKKMVDAETINESERALRRCRFILSLRNDTPSYKLEALIKDLREYLSSQPALEGSPNVHFSEFGINCLDVTVSCLLRIPDGDEYLTARQAINFRTIELMKQHGCEFSEQNTKVVIGK